VLSGEIYALLDVGEVLMKPEDVPIQRARIMRGKIGRSLP